MTIISEKIKISKPQDIAEIMFRIYDQNDELDKSREQLYLIGLDTRNNILGIDLISMGTINESLVSNREVFRTALVKNYVSVILVHNHPSGDNSPSGADVSVTEKIAKAGVLIGIALVDHLIIADHTYTSMKAHGLINK